MTTTIDATYDGNVFRPVEPVSLAPNTSVRLTVHSLPLSTDKPISFLRTALSLNLEGPPDWASQLDKYLYGEEATGAG